MRPTDPSPQPSPAAEPLTPTADRVIHRAARWVDEGRRLDLQTLADELGISRATVFRHVGGREELLSKAL